MAVRFAADGQDYTTSLTLGSQAAISASCWVKITTDRNAFSTAISLDSGTGDALFIQTAVNGTTMGIYEEPLGNFAGTGRALTVGTWYWFGFSINGTTGTMYSRALADTTVATAALTGLQATHNIATLRIGESAWGTEWLNGAVTAVKVWTAALAQAELENEALAHRPRRTANLAAWYPLTRAETADYSGNAKTLTGGTGAATEDGPGIGWGPGRPRRVKKASSVSQALTLAAETGTAQALGKAKRRDLGVASALGTAQSLARRKTQTLSIAAETDTAQAVTSPGTPIEDLVDDFNDGTVDPVLWPNSFGTYSETGGRARVACATGYSAFSSALDYTLTGSSVFLRSYPPAAGGATTEAWSQILIKSAVAGTDIGFEHRLTTGELTMFSRVGFVDGGEVAIAYSATDHAWLRIRETGGTTYWDTSPDGATWTNRRSLASPAWTSDNNLEFQLIAHRSDGTDDFAEFDNVNVAPAIVQALDVAGESDGAQPFGARRTKTPGLASETGSAQALAVRKAKTVGLGAESGATQALTRRKSKTVGPSTATETSLGLGKTKRLPLGVAQSADAAQPVQPTKTAALPTAQSGDDARALGKSKTTAVGTTGETDTAVQLAAGRARLLALAAEEGTARQLGRSRSLGQSFEDEAAQPIGRVKTKPLQLTAESTVGQAFGAVKTRQLSPAVGQEAAQALGQTRSRTLGTAVEETAALPIGAAKSKVLPSPLGAEASQPLLAVKTGSLGQASGVEAAQPVGRVKALPLSAVTADEVAQPLGGARDVPLGSAGETGTALPLGSSKTAALSPADGLDAAVGLTAGKARAVGAADVVEVAQTLTSAKRRALAPAAVVDTAQPLGARRARPIGIATESAQALPLTAADSIAAAVEVGTAHPLGRSKTKAISGAVETAASIPLAAGKMAALGTAVEADAARPVSTAPRFGIAASTEFAMALRRAKRTALSAAGAAEASGLLAVRKARPINPATEADTALAFGSSVPPPTDRDIVVGAPYSRWKSGEPHGDTYTSGITASPWQAGTPHGDDYSAGAPDDSDWEVAAPC